MVLASCSSYFQAMFSSGYKESQWRPDRLQEICLPGIGAEALGQVLEFVYTGSLELSPANIQSVLACASQLQVSLLHSHWSRNVEARLSLVESFPSDLCASNLMP